MRRVLAVLLGAIILFAAATSFAGVCGDVNGDEKVNLLDVSSIINFLYRGGAALECGGPYTSICGDFNYDGKVNLIDASRILDNLYREGPALICLELGEVTDIDGNTYRTVKIGDQWWMAENLKATHYQNGDTIPNVTNSAAWEGLTTGAYCEQNNDISNVTVYGRLYNWFAATDSRNIAPAGWHVSTDVDWQQLEMFLGLTYFQAAFGNAFRGTDEGGKLKEVGTTHWLSPNTGATNETGFSGLPGGYRNGIGSYDNSIGYCTFIWTSTEAYDDWADGFAKYRNLSSNDSRIYRLHDYMTSGFSVRCVKD
jgi:uncharacterized protein (TIGR02145 family)